MEISYYLCSINRGVEQLVARWAHNPKVSGSSPVPATLKPHNGAFFMFTVYALYSESSDKIYIGYTSDLEARMLSHNELATKGYTVKYRPWKVVYTEEHSEKREAMKREKSLKSAKGRAFIWSIIRG